MSYSRLITFIAILVILTTACGETVPNETWSLVELVTKGERTDSATVTVEVRNCGVVERKTHDCSAGTSNNLSVSLGGGIQAVNASVSSSLGIGRNSGQSLSFDSPPEGFIYRYTVREEYQIATGDVKAHSSSGAEQVANYTFRAGCSLKIESQETLTCSGNASPPQSTKPIARPSDTPLPSRRPAETPISPPTPLLPTPTAIPDTPQGTVLELGQTWYQGNKSIRIYNVPISSSEYFYIELDITNIGAQTINFQLAPKNFLIKNNRGQIGAVEFGWISDPIILAPNETYTIGGSAPWIRVSRLSTAEQAVYEVIISVSVSNVTNAQWRVPIYH